LSIVVVLTQPGVPRARNAGAELLPQLDQRWPGSFGAIHVACRLVAEAEKPDEWSRLSRDGERLDNGVRDCGTNYRMEVRK